MTTENERVCEWYESGHIQAIDELVDEFDNTHHGVTITAGYMDDTFHAIHLADWKTEFKAWASNLINDLQAILDEVEELPDDEYELYLEVGDVYTGIDFEDDEEDEGDLILMRDKQ